MSLAQAAAEQTQPRGLAAQVDALRRDPHALEICREKGWLKDAVAALDAERRNEKGDA